MTRSKIAHHLVPPAPEARALPPRPDEIVVIVAYTIAAMALFGGFLIHRLPDSHLLQGALVGGGIVALTAAALWLDRRGSEREAAEGEATARAARSKPRRAPSLPRPGFARRGTEPLGSGG